MPALHRCPEGSKQFQRELCAALVRKGFDAKAEWASFTASYGHYSPRLDIAIGPFAVDPGGRDDEYHDLLRERASLLHAMWTCHTENVCNSNHPSELRELETLRHANPNPRCLIAIEIETHVTRKHLMGGAINAAALGKLGIVIGGSDKALKALVRTRDYLLFLAGADKPSFPVTNLLILSKVELWDCVHRSC